jgi:hypothetical protein
VALNAAGDRLLISQPYNSVYSPPDDDARGVTYVLDYNYGTQSWPTSANVFNSGGYVISGSAGPGFSYILGTKFQCLGNSLAINADGSIIALGSNQAATRTGVLNLYNFKTKLALTGVNTLASNGTLTVAGGVGTTNIFATSTDGITFNNSVSDASGVLLNGTVAGVSNTGISLVSILENPNLTTGAIFGGNATSTTNPGNITLNAAGTVMAVGAQAYNTNSGIVYMYTAPLYGPWTLVQTISDPSGSINQYFGAGLNLNASGTILAVSKVGYLGFKGAVCLYGANSTLTSWSLLQIAYGSGTIEQFGKTCLLNAVGNILMVGANAYPNNLGYGQVYAYRANTNLTNWVIDASFSNPNGNKADGFGQVLAINAAGTVMAAGAPGYDNGGNKGRVYIYTYTNGAWTQQAGLNATLTGATNGDLFGNCVSFNAAGTILAVGTVGLSGAAFTGKVFVYTTTTNWASIVAGTLSQTGVAASNYFGSGLALNASGDILIVDAAGFNPDGRVYVYKTTNNWTSSFPTALTIDASGGNFGNNLAINAAGNVIVCGASTYNTNTGRVYTYTYNPPVTVLNTRTCKALATNGTMWVAGGPSTTNPLAWSNDGSTWYPSLNGTSAFPFSGSSCNALASSGGTLWVAGGTGNNPLAYSYDGMTWYQSILNQPTLFTVCNAVTWNGMYWLASGNGLVGNSYNTQAYSADGITWTAGTDSSALFSGNNGFALATRRNVSTATAINQTTAITQATSNLALQATAVGASAGQTNQGKYATALGVNAGSASQTDRATAVGVNAGRFSQGASAVAVGNSAGISNQTAYATAVGVSAGAYNQNDRATAVGVNAGQFSQGSSAVAVGNVAGVSNQAAYATAVGVAAGAFNQGSSSVAIGNYAGGVNQGNGLQGIAIGLNAGSTNQSAYAISIGTNSALTNQGTQSVAIGSDSGATSQGTYAVAIGQAAGLTSQGNRAIAIGHGAGYAGQGTAAVAIGEYAGWYGTGNTTKQAANSIVINATGGAINNIIASSCVIAPMRNETTSNNSTNTYLPLYYNNNGTGELVTLPNQLASTLSLANNTAYQNTTTRIQIVAISAYLNSGQLLQLLTSPVNSGYFEVDVAFNPSSTSQSYVTGTAFIPVGWYFKYINAGTFNFARIIG